MMNNNQYTDREANIYRQYQDTIAPFIAELEVRDTEYPIEIFNELRAVFTHLARYKLQGSDDDLKSSESHTKRAILDCFKYMCISYAEELYTFRKSYRHVDLKLANNGIFLPELDRLERISKNLYRKAKFAEIRKSVKIHGIHKPISDDKLYTLFEDAYNAYKTTSDLLVTSQEAILFASSHSKISNAWTIISTIVTIISVIVTIATFKFADLSIVDVINSIIAYLNP